MFFGHLAEKMFNFSPNIHVLPTQMALPVAAQHSLNLNKIHLLSWKFTKAIRLTAVLEGPTTRARYKLSVNEGITDK